MADVVLRGKWYPAPVPPEPEESDVDYTNRVLGLAGKKSPYDHLRYRECSIGYHRSCTQRHALGLANAFTDNKLSYVGKCQCPCHFDTYSLVADEPLREAVEILCDIYDLPNRTGWHVMHTVDMMTGTTTPAGPVRVYSVAARLREEYDSEVTHAFATDVVRILSHKGPAGPARAFWEEVHRHRDESSPKLSDVIRSAVAKAKWANNLFEQKPPTIEVVHKGRSVYSFEVPREFLGLPEPVAQKLLPPPELPQAKLFGFSALANPAMPVGLPVVVDESLPPGTWKVREADGHVRVGTPWPRVTLPGVETLSEALARVGSNPHSPPERDITAPSFIRWLFRQPWFTRGVERIDASHTYGVDPAKLAWYIPATLASSFRIRPGQPNDTELYGVKVRVHDKLRDDAAPILAFDLEEN